LEYLKKEYKKRKEQKNNVDKLISKAREIIEKIDSNISLINEDDLRSIFERINEIDTDEMMVKFRNIKVISIYFNNDKFNKQPQVVAAMKWLDEIRNLLVNYLNALERMVSDKRLDSLDIYQQQIELVEKINRQEMVSSEELEKFYNWLMDENENQLEINEVVMEVFNYLSRLLNEEINSVEEEVIVKKTVDQTEEESLKYKNFNAEEIIKLEEYHKKINQILKLAKAYNLTIPKISDLVKYLESEIELPREFIEHVKEKVGFDLTLENLQLLDKFNDILELNDDNKFEIFETELRDMLKKFDDMFQVVEEQEENQELLDILENPQSLVVFLTNEDTQGMVSYVEEDYEREIKNRDRKKARTAVKKIITHFYTGNIDVRYDGEEKKLFGDTRVKILHASPERDIRCFYAVLPVSESVKKYLCHTYNINKENMRDFRVYLYTGFGHIGNHETNYADEYYNRCNLPLNIAQVKRLISLFLKNELTNDDKIQIDNLINCSLEIVKKLNNIERKKRYE